MLSNIEIPMLVTTMLIKYVLAYVEYANIQKCIKQFYT